MQIKYIDVPQWLKDSDFFRSLADDELDSHIDIPSDCFTTKQDSVHTIEDFAAILKVMKFWGVKYIPHEILEFCTTNEYSVWKGELDNSGMVELNVQTTALNNPKLFSLEVAVSTNRNEFVDFWLSKNKAESIHGKNAIAQACRYGRLDLVETLREQGFAWDTFAYCAAAQYGRLACLHYLHENGCPCEGKSFVYAVRGGQLECMKYLHVMGCRWDKNLTMEYAVPAHYQTITRGAQLFGSDQPWIDDFSFVPPDDACVNCLRYALENDCQIRDHACSRVFRYGLLECLKLLHEHGAAWNSVSAAAAAEFGHLDCLQYLHEHGCPWDAKCLLHAVQGGHLDCLQYLHMNGCPWDVRSSQIAAEHGHLGCLMYLHEHDCPWDKSAVKCAAENGHLHCLLYLREHGCPWDESILQSVFIFTQDSALVASGEKAEKTESNDDILRRHLAEERGMVQQKNRRMKGQM